MYKTTDFRKFIDYIFGDRYHHSCDIYSILFEKGLRDLTKLDIIIAGGCFRDTLIHNNFKDIDIYVKDQDYFEIPDYIANSSSYTILNKNLVQKYPTYGFEKFSVWKTNYEYSGKFQLSNKRKSIDVDYIGVPNLDPKFILDTYDFTINQFALYGKCQLMYNHYAMGHLLARELHFTDYWSTVLLKLNPNQKAQVKKRILRFLDKGFKLSESVNYWLINN